MLSKLKSLFSGGASAPRDDNADDAPLAIAALLVEAARVDERYEAREQAIIEKALARKFGLDGAAAKELRTRGEEAQAKATDLHRFTKTAKTLSADEKRSFVETLWRIVLSDGDRDAYEDALIRRLCGLIYLSDQESGAARQRVENELQASKDA